MRYPARLVALSSLVATVVRAQTTVTVNASSTFQTMDGFGFSEAFGHAAHIQAYSEPMRTQVLDLLFNSTVGIGARILRNRIGSGTTSSDSILPNSPGCPTCTPSYAWGSGDTGQVWLTKEAIKRGVKYIYANAWSAPGFMKTNNNEANGGNLCGTTSASCSSGSWMQAYANMLVQYVKYYQQEGITVTHLGFLNEPDLTTTYSSMRSTGKQAADFLKVLQPTVQNAGLSTQITCCDSMGWDNQVTMTADIKAAGAEQYLNVYTSHAYANVPDTTLTNVTKPVWQTEVADLGGALLPNNWYSNGGKGEGLTVANDILSAIVSARLSAYLYWQGAEPGNTNAALILTSGTTITVSKRAWAFAQWSRYVQPGAVRLGTTGSGTNLRFTAFRNTDGTFSVQVINNGASSAAIRVAASGFTPTSAVAFTSAQGTDLGSLAVTFSAGVAAATVAARSMSTFILRS